MSASVPSAAACERRPQARLTLAVLLLAAVTFLTGVLWATTAASGADSHGYVAQADGWLAGHLTTDQSWAADAPWPMARWTLTPLGYRPSVVGGEEWVLVPAYSPGLPMLMAAAKLMGGQEALFWVVPLSGAVLVLATFGIARRLVAPGAGLVAAWLVATSPTVLFMLMVPMSDLPAAAAWATSFCFLLDPRATRAAWSGIAAGLAILIRPNLAPCAAVMAAWWLVRAFRAAPAERRHALAGFGSFMPGVAAGALAIATINTTLNGSPLISGYGSLADAFSLAFLMPNLLRYGSWLIETQTPVVIAGAIALVVPAGVLWPGARRGAPLVMAALTATVWVSYCLYRQFDAWWFLRFLLPSWPFLMAGTAAVLHLAMHRIGSRFRALGIVAIGVLGLWQIGVAIDRGVFNLWKEERRAITVARQVRQLTPPDSVIFSRQHSGSVRYYAGRLTARFEEFEPGDVDRAVAWFAERGVRSYLLLDDAELAMARESLAGQDARDRLNDPPRLHYSGTMQAYLFELDRPADRGIPTVSIIDTWEGTRRAPPVPYAVPGALLERRMAR